MPTIEEHLVELSSPQNVRFERLLTICREHFEEQPPRGSHHRFKTPWPGDPRVNLQKSKGGKAKRYQVRQVAKALAKMASLAREQTRVEEP